MTSRRVHERGLRSSSLPSLALIFTSVTQIILSLFGTQSLDIIVLTVYVDNILLTGSDSAGLLETNEYLKRHFVTRT